MKVYGEVSKRKRKSVTEFVLEAVEEKLAREREAELFKGFQSLVPEADLEVTERLMELQKKAMARVDD